MDCAELQIMFVQRQPLCVIESGKRMIKLITNVSAKGDSHPFLRTPEGVHNQAHLAQKSSLPPTSRLSHVSSTAIRCLYLCGLRSHQQSRTVSRSSSVYRKTSRSILPRFWFDAQDPITRVRDLPLGWIQLEIRIRETLCSRHRRLPEEDRRMWRMFPA